MVSQFEHGIFGGLEGVFRQTVKAFEHTQRLPAGHQGDLRVIPPDQSDGTRMVRLHVVDDQVVDRPIAEDGAYLFEVGVEVAGFDGIYQGGFLVGDQVGVVRDPFRQGPHAFEQSSGAVVHSYVVDVSFERMGGVHGVCLVFKVCIFGRFFSELFSMLGTSRSRGCSRERGRNARYKSMRIFKHLRIFLFDSFGKNHFRKRKQI